MCKVGNNLLFTDPKGGCILKYDLEFQFVNKISSISSIKLKDTNLIASDELENVYILFQHKNDQSEIIITDLNLRMQKYNTIKSGDEVFQDMKYNNNELHVLSEKAIYIYSSKGESIRELELRVSNDTYLSNPQMMCITDSLAILLDSPTKLYFFEKKSGETIFWKNLNRTVKTISLVNDYLFVHTGCGSFICYKLTSDNKDIVQVFHREIPSLQEVSASIVYCNSGLAILLPFQNMVLKF
jgi:hypothetical protein